MLNERWCDAAKTATYGDFLKVEFILTSQIKLHLKLYLQSSMACPEFVQLLNNHRDETLTIFNFDAWPLSRHLSSTLFTKFNGKYLMNIVESVVYVIKDVTTVILLYDFLIANFSWFSSSKRQSVIRLILALAES